MTQASVPRPPRLGEPVHRDKAHGAPKLTLSQALALGLLHGPAELLPVSSSAHTALLPWLAGWPYTQLDADLRKSFEVALHAGTAAALLLRPPGTLLGGRVTFLIPALAAPALAGYALGAQVERRLGTPATIAAGLLAGSVWIGAGTVSACARSRTGHLPRTVASAGWQDGVTLGIAQTLALFPGISRNGATLASARARGFSRLDADRLSWQAGLPVIAGATALKLTQLACRGMPRDLRLPLAVGAAGAFTSTLLSSTLLGPERRTRLLGASVAYRGALALLVIRRMRDNTH